MKTKFKKGDIVYWQDLQGEVMNTDNSEPYTIKVKFFSDYGNYFTNDGRIHEDIPPVLSHTPYTLNGFTQNSVIEKDTLVWVRDSDDGCWDQRFYSHFKNGKHHCFANQETSKETNLTISWAYLETENPLLKKLKNEEK